MGDSHATGNVRAFLGHLSAALDKADSIAAKALFTPDCYWRDLVAFTWNIKTMEGPAAVGAMLEATLANVRPHNWPPMVTGTPSTREAVASRRGRRSPIRGTISQ